MKAIEQFKMEAVEQFGAGSVISEESAKQILKTIGRSGFGLGQLCESFLEMKVPFRTRPIIMLWDTEVIRYSLSALTIPGHQNT